MRLQRGPAYFLIQNVFMCTEPIAHNKAQCAMIKCAQWLQYSDSCIHIDNIAIVNNCIAVLTVPLVILVRVQALSQLATSGRPMGRRTIGPASSGLGEGLAGRDVHVPLRSSDSCGGPGVCTLTRSPGVRCFLRHVGVAGWSFVHKGKA